MGLCKNCQSMFQLFMLAPGKKARVAYIDGGRGIRQKLANIGIIPGKNIKIIHGGGGGPCVIKVDETNVMVGRGMLHKIYVELYRNL